MRIFSNTAISIDGKITSYAVEVPELGSEQDRTRMSELRAQADCVLVGGSTFRCSPYSMRERPEHRVKRNSPMVNAILTARGELDTTASTFRNPDIIPVIFCATTTTLPSLPAHVHVVRTEVPTVKWVTDVLRHQFRVSSLLIEGGGQLIFQFIEAQLLQEMFVTLCPLVIGGEKAVSLVDGQGFLLNDSVKATLESCDRIGDELFLHYRLNYRTKS